MGSNLSMEMLYLSSALVISMENGQPKAFAFTSSVEHEEVLADSFNVKEDGQKMATVNMFQKDG